MLCLKCQKEAGDGYFCPNCGNRLEIREDMTEKDTIEETAVDDTSFGLETPPKKIHNRKWGKVAAVLIAVFIVLGVGTYYAFPYVCEAVSPKAYAAAALKKTTGQIQSSFNSIFTNVDLTQQTVPKEISASFELNKLDVDNISYLSDFSERKVMVDIQTSIKDDIVAGSLQFGTDKNSSLQMDFYMTADNLKIRVPQLASETFVINMDTILSDTGFSYSEIKEVVALLGNSQVQSYLNQYSDVLSALMKDVMSGVITLIDNCEYTSAGKTTYQSENGDFKVSEYTVTITQEAVRKCMMTVVDSIFSDSELTSYVAMLKLYMGITQEKLTETITQMNIPFEEIPVTLYINSDKVIVKAMTAISDTLGHDCDLSVEFIGQDNPYSYVVLQCGLDNTTTVKEKIIHEGDSFTYDVTITPDDSEDNINFSVNGSIASSEDKTTIAFSKIGLSGTVENEKLDFIVSGDYTIKNIDAVSIKDTSFANAIDSSNMTQEQKTAIKDEISTNLGKLNGKISAGLIGRIKEYVDKL